MLARTNSPLTKAVVRELLDYDRTTGVLRWRRRGRSWFTSERIYRSWNGRYPGTVAGSLSPRGYVQLGVLGIVYKAHRVAFLWVTGRWPMPEIDHENRKRSDNRWSNLREATSEENKHNSSRWKGGRR